ncbi:MAG: hypothetical protein AAF493_02750 [Pseudomonadota bacterium]
MIGEVGGIQIDMAKYKRLAHLGYMDYTSVEEVFEMPRPSDPPRG